MSVRGWTTNPVLGGDLPTVGVSSMSAGLVITAPSDITGLVGWYDFSDITTLWKDAARSSAVTADGDIILGVTDKSGAGKHLSAATGPTYKVAIQNSRSVGRFDGVDDSLTNAAITADTSFTTFIVAIKRSAPTAASKDLFVYHANAQFFTNSTSDATHWGWFANGALGVVMFTTGTVATSWSIIGLRFNSASSTDAWVGGGATTNFDPDDNATTSTNLFLGALTAGGGWSDVDIAEMVRYSSALTLSQVNALGSYFATRWSAAWSTAS